MSILILAAKSLLNRRFTALLTLLSIALSVALLLGVERVRNEARASFSSTISGTDLIVGARSGPVQLLLYSVFRIGNATNNISWQSYLDLAGHPKVAWTVPISLGDSHRGFRVLGTTGDYFDHYRYARDRGLELAAGERFDDLFDAVLGAEVADALGYSLGDEIIIAHGAGDVRFARHDDKPFRVAGILKRTGTPVDRTVHVSLEAIEAVHLGWQGGAPMPGLSTDAAAVRAMDLTPDAITAVLVGLKSKIAAFAVQRYV
ncbi:MAG: ABC transporter permease, partial [Thiohalocapsa sp.]